MIQQFFYIIPQLSVAPPLSSSATNLHQPLRLLDNPTGQSRHGESFEGEVRRKECRLAPEVEVSSQVPGRSWSWRWTWSAKGCSGHDSRCPGGQTFGETVTTSGPGIGAAAVRVARHQSSLNETVSPSLCSHREYQKKRPKKHANPELHPLKRATSLSL